jgi:SAM-dependent methyltransferase
MSKIYPAVYTAFRSNKGMVSTLVQKARNFVHFLKFRKLAPELRSNDAILEFGCGSGELLRVIESKSSSTRRIVGIDLSDYAAQELAGSRIEFWQGDILRYPGEQGSFGAVILNQVIEHMADPMQVFEKIHYLLRDKGLIYLETPVLGAWDSRLFPLRFWGGWHTPRHFVIFSQKTLTEALIKSKFDVLEASYIFSPFIWANTLEFFFREQLKLPRVARFFRISVFPYLCVIGVIELIQLLLTGRTSNLRVMAKRI